MTKCLGASLKEVDIKASVTQHFKDIGHDMEAHDVTFENAQARERTQVLMDLANQCQGMVIGTGDLSELALGWATYNGDHMSMYGVNSSKRSCVPDVPKVGSVAVSPIGDLRMPSDACADVWMKELENE